MYDRKQYKSLRALEQNTTTITTAAANNNKIRKESFLRVLLIAMGTSKEGKEILKMNYIKLEDDDGEAEEEDS